MKITYFNRNKNIGFSIEKVFKITTKEIGKKLEIEKVSMPSSRSMPWDLVNNCRFTLQNRNKKGINHITGHIHEVIIGLIGCKVIITIHDLVFLDNTKNPVKSFYKWLFWFYLPIKLADKIVCISEHTKDNILKRINAKNLSVIYNPIDPRISFSQKEFCVEKPIILHIGTGWNKNLNRVVEALSNIPCHLRIIGKLTPGQKEILKSFNVEYSNAYNLSDHEIIEEYENCDIVSFPSEYEGFGMPVIEGQKIGRVVVTSKIEPLIEVSKEGVCYVNPLDVSSIREGFLKVANDENYRNKKINLGKINVERFAVEKIAKQYIDLYKIILK